MKEKNNLGRATRKKSSGNSCSCVSMRRVTCGFETAGASLHAAKRLQMGSHRDDFAQHPQTIAEKIDFAPFSVVPADGNFPNAQSGAIGEKKQLNIECKAIHMRRLQNRPTNIELKGLEPALGVPKWQAGCDAHKKIENTTPLLAPPGLMDSD